MGFSIAGAFAVIGVTLFIALDVFLAGMMPAVSDVNYGFHEMKDRAVFQKQTNISITSISTVANDSNYDLKINVSNEGSTTLKTIDFNILINGTNYLFNRSKQFLYPEKFVNFTVPSLSGTGNRILKIITPVGVSDYENYTISV